MRKYSTSFAWEDVIPIPQNDGGPNPLAAIAYTEEYSEAMSYLRSIMTANEKSERALELTEHIIRMNPAHYTVWLYRANTLFELQKQHQSNLEEDILDEIKWLDDISLKHLKNYQIWHHRQTLLSALPSLPSTELPFLALMLSKDTKNYHVWSYRQWLVRHFSLWDTNTEIPYVESLLDHDVRNNSAWNHRWFVFFGRDVDPESGKGMDEVGNIVDEDLLDREVDFAKGKIGLAPQNQSPWNYLRGLLRKRGSLLECKAFAQEFVGDAEGEGCRSSHALDFLADCWAEEQEKDKAGKMLELLARRFDPIRRNYWNWKRGLLGLEAVEAGPLEV
ncbi:MAG: hypothetical protein Q9212_003035 [Teloschistes hypoglaucus]